MVIELVGELAMKQLEPGQLHLPVVALSLCPIGRIQRENPHVADRGSDEAALVKGRLRLATEPVANVVKADPANQRNPVS